MAIQISGTTVIDNSRNLINLSQVYANGVVGSASSIFTSTGAGIRWRDLASILADAPATYLNYLTINTTSANYGDLTQTYVTSSSNDNVSFGSTDIYGLFSSTGTSTLSIDVNGNLVYTI
jgi:hypothetical protein